MEQITTEKNTGEAAPKHETNFLEGDTTKNVMVALVIVIIAFLVFNAGVFVGYHRASFSYQMGEGYYRVFEGSHPPPGIDEIRVSFPDSHGATGKIVSIALPHIVIADQDQVEKTVELDADTMIRQFRSDVKPEDLRVGDLIVVLGEPDERGVIDAKLVRVMPPPPDTATSTQRM